MRDQYEEIKDIIFEYYINSIAKLLLASLSLMAERERNM